ncbi:MAG TPA: hypothetical protein VFA85_08025 [Terriglobales bacterium]|nr:hypothetical protein [Terriglobales bacterium]
MKYFGIALVAIGLVATVALALAARTFPKIARRAVIGELEERFHSTIEIGEIRITHLFPPRILVRDITLRYHGRSDIPPLMVIERLTGSADVRSLWSRNWRLTTLHLDGLSIRILPRGDSGGSYIALQKRPGFQIPPIEFDEITSDDALLEILPSLKQGKPHTFRIHHLLLRSVVRGQPAYFHAELTNPVPAGEIESEGTFGPWDPDEPGLTPVAANFIFANADLGQFRGISGTLSSTGHYGGVLERLGVQGTASVPDFKLSIARMPVPLRVDYVAAVDGMNGNTYLRNVTAHFQQTTVALTGEIIDPPGPLPRKIVLSASARDARAEDLLRLVTQGKDVPLKGAVTLETRLELPSGPGELMHRLLLWGRFEISHAVFENPETRAEIAKFSSRAQGKPYARQIAPVSATIRGNLVLKKANADLSNLEFRLPGASLFLNGSYGLESESLDFHGRLRLAAKLSQTTTGVKSFLLQAFNPLFKDAGGGSTLAVKVTGTRAHPAFGLDFRKSALRIRD